MDKANQQKQVSAQGQPPRLLLQAPSKIPYLLMGLAALAGNLLIIFFTQHQNSFKLLFFGIEIIGILTLWLLAKIFRARGRLFGKSLFSVGFYSLILVVLWSTGPQNPMMLSSWLSSLIAFMGVLLIMVIYCALLKYVFEIGWIKSIVLGICHVMATLMIMLIFAGM